MRKILTLTATTLAIFTSAFSMAGDNPSFPLERLPKVKARIKAGEPVTIVGLGDSITTYIGNRSRNSKYYPYPIEMTYYGVFASYLKMSFPGIEMRVINKGIGGETADRGLKRVESDVLALKPDLVFVMYGANDGRGGRDMSLFKDELTEIVTKIKASGSDVVLVAPTMSLADLAWLLPCRQAVLSLSDKLDCPVLDGTLAIWPVDEGVYSLDDVARYISLHFPPDGDDIHPGFAGHFQMGRRLVGQLASEGKRKSRLAFSIACSPKIPGPITQTMKIKNVSGAFFSGSIQPFFDHDMPILGFPVEDIGLPNGAKEKRLSLPVSKLELEAGAEAEIRWDLNLKNPEDFVADLKLLRWLRGDYGVGVAVFADDGNDIAFVKPDPSPISVRLNGPRSLEAQAKPSFTASISNTSAETFNGAWSLVGAGEWNALTIQPSSTNDVAFNINIRTDSTATTKTRQGVMVKNSDGVTIALDAFEIEATPCVDIEEKYILVDSEFEDWSGCSWRKFDAGSAKASFALARKDGILFVALRCEDPVMDFQRSPIWFGDGFELYFDVRYEDKLGTHGPLFQIGVFPPKDVSAPLILAPGTGAAGANLSKIKTAWRRDVSGYAIEVSIPVELIGFSGLSEGRIFGFGVACNDVSKEGQIRTQYQWAGTNRNYATPVSYGLARWGSGQPVWSLRYQH